VAKGLVNKPEDIEPNISGLEFYALAFTELSTSRPVSMAVGAIPFTAILEYFRVYPVGDFDEFLDIIRSMDNEYLRLEDAKSKNKPREVNGQVRESSTDNQSNLGRKGRGRP
jgi:hypothetical protein